MPSVRIRDIFARSITPSTYYDTRTVPAESNRAQPTSYERTVAMMRAHANEALREAERSIAEGTFQGDPSTSLAHSIILSSAADRNPSLRRHAEVRTDALDSLYNSALGELMDDLFRVIPG